MKLPEHDCVIKPDEVNKISDELKGMVMWSVYDHPDDYPKYYVARAATTELVTGFILIHHKLEPIRKAMQQAGFVCVERETTDEAIIVETWL